MIPPWCIAVSASSGHQPPSGHGAAPWSGPRQKYAYASDRSTRRPGSFAATRTIDSNMAVTAKATQAPQPAWSFTDET